MTVSEESRRLFNTCKHNAKRELDVIPYISGTKNKRTRMYKMAARYREDAEIDFELGVINKDEYDLDIKAVRLFEKMLANFKTD